MKEQDHQVRGNFAESKGSPKYPPWIFQHGKLFDDLDDKHAWDQTKLVNKLNHINFIDGYLYSLFLEPQTNKQILVKTHPQPCIKEKLMCTLELPDGLSDLSQYKFHYLMIEDGLNMILVPANFIAINGCRLTLNLPEKSYLSTNRRTKRFPSQDISAEMIQDNLVSTGFLVDFTPQAFGIKFNQKDDSMKYDENVPVMISLAQNGTKLFSGKCRCIRNGINSPDGKVIFAPIDDRVSLYPKREMRNPRQHIVPSLSISFKHPFFESIVERDICEISTSGFSVLDKPEEETFLPGMIIPAMSIVYAGILKMECSAQVIYRKQDDATKMVQCGLAIADMDVKSYSKLNHILMTYLDHNARVSTEVDMDALWEFFFDTGFIYGEKYEHLYPYRETFKETYRKLYQDNPDIARHFVYEKNGKIYGHIAMVHAYEPSWVIQHFSARPLESKMPGFMILRQITHFLNGCYRFFSGNTNYVMTYYRPDNRIVHKIFGGFAEYLSNKKGSSLDLFSYIRFHKSPLYGELPPNWTLRKCTATDYEKLSDFYMNNSGGLLLDSFRLDSNLDQVKESFTKAGFVRDCQLFCLRHAGIQVAYFIVNQSDLGLNLSDLLNGIQVIITDQNIKWDILLSAINKLSSIYKEDHFPLLVYPADYLSEQNIATDKSYLLWILKTNPYIDNYTEYMGSKFRMKYKA